MPDQVCNVRLLVKSRFNHSSFLKKSVGLTGEDVFEYYIHTWQILPSVKL